MTSLWFQQFICTLKHQFVTIDIQVLVIFCSYLIRPHVEFRELERIVQLTVNLLQNIINLKKIMSNSLPATATFMHTAYLVHVGVELPAWRLDAEVVPPLLVDARGVVLPAGHVPPVAHVRRLIQLWYDPHTLNMGQNITGRHIRLASSARQIMLCLKRVCCRKG